MLFKVIHDHKDDPLIEDKMALLDDLPLVAGDSINAYMGDDEFGKLTAYFVNGYGGHSTVTIQGPIFNAALLYPDGLRHIYTHPDFDYLVIDTLFVTVRVERRGE